MLNRLHLINFRRHVDTELTFSSDAQIVAITGSNGAGKTSILEALTYGLYGESRHGRRNLARMVRRGGEHEGMQVEIDFRVGDVEYQLVRRFEKGKASATLMANGNLIMQSPDGVTSEIVKIFGMDSAGFRLAVIAQQFDVDGLADLTPGKRRKTITRLLRQDALTRAKLTAADEKNRQLDIIRAFGDGPHLEDYVAELSEAEEEVDAAQAALADSLAAVAQIDKALGETGQVREEWHEAQMGVVRAEATLQAVSSEASRLLVELNSLRVPEDVPAPEVSFAKAVAELADVNIAVATAEQAADMLRIADQTRTELAGIDKQLVDVEARLDGDTPASVAMAAAHSGTALAAAQERLDSARAEAAAANERRLGPTGELAALRARREKVSKLGDVCETCEQPITAEHKERQRAEQELAEQELLTQVSELAAAADAATTAVRVAEDALVAARSERDRLAARRAIVEQSVTLRKDLVRRKEQYEARLARLVVEPVDLDALYARKAVLEAAKAAAEAFEKTRSARVSALERRALIEGALADAHERVRAAEADVAAAEPPPSLVQAHAQVVDLEQQRVDEQEMVAAIQAELAAAEERRVGAAKALDGARAQVDKVAQFRRGADLAAKTARLLDVTADRMATQIRPALQVAISVALAQLSEGRFTAVEVSDSYEITVLDDGRFEPLSELSGGERVLVALATRLALAQVVAGRHASGGVGLLVLDEVFGSQDAERREAIMSALRALRGEYGQILLISHVGGLEDVADHVIDVSIRVEGGSRVAEVSAT